MQASDISLTRRIVAYVTMLSGYLFYCYNYLVLDYVRPYLISDYGMSLKGTATISAAQAISVTIGALVAAPAVAHWGRRKVMFTSALAIGLLAIVSGASHGLGGWLTARGLMAIFLASYYVVGINLTVALFPPHVRAKLSAVSSGLFSIAEMMVGGLGGALGDQGWQGVVWIGAIPVLIAPLILFLVPEDRTFVAYGSAQLVPGSSGGWREMVAPKWRRITIACVLLAGLNLIGYQAFSGFVTLYLRQVRAFSAPDMGATIALIGTGSLMGGFFWAYIADRFGRKVNAIGFVGTALFICLFLVVPHERVMLQAFGFLYGFCLSSAYCWGIWFTELFPVRLRPYGAALFHAGHLIAWAAPLASAWAAGYWGLATALWLAPASFLLGAVLWLTLPETLKTGVAYRGWDPESR